MDCHNDATAAHMAVAGNPRLAVNVSHGCILCGNVLSLRGGIYFLAERLALAPRRERGPQHHKSMILPTDPNEGAGAVAPAAPCSACHKPIDMFDAIGCPVDGCPKLEECKQHLMAGPKLIDSGQCPNGCGPLIQMEGRKHCPACGVNCWQNAQDQP